MRSTPAIYILLLFLGGVIPSFAVAAKKSERGEGLTVALRRAHLNAGEVGGGIWDLQDDKTLLEHRADFSMIPASLSKIVTALAVLDRFPASTHFETRVLITEPMNEGIVNGDLIIEGGGDPAFVSEAMADLVAQIKKSGLKRVNGNVIVNDQRFDRERFDSHRESNRVDRAYDAPIGALSFDWNAVSIFVRPGLHSGDPAQVHLEPGGPYLRLVNTSQTVEKGVSTISTSRTPIKEGAQADKVESFPSSAVIDQISVTGKIGREIAEKAYYKGISRPDLWTASHLIQFLKREKIEVTGNIKLGAHVADKQNEVLAVNESPSIGELVLSMMKFSNNFIAEMLTKNLAVLGDKNPQNASMDKGISEIQKWLQHQNLKGVSWTFVNPSGLTNENRLTPSQLGQLLKFAYANLKIYPEFTSSLPIAGLDGTLKHRAKKSAGQIRAKTGLLKDAGVAALAGFATTPSGHTRAFVWIVNRAHKIQNLQPIWDFLDTMATSAAMEQE